MNTRNFVFFHDSSGHVDAVAPMVSHLSSDIQVLGVERGCGTTRMLTVTDLAADHLKRLRRMQSTGPWYLAGWSFGGNLAFEVARQLEAEGQEVKLLVLIDSEPPCLNDWQNLYQETLDTIDGIGFYDEYDLERLVEQVASLNEPYEAINAKLPSSIRDAIPPAEHFDHARYCRALGTVIDHVRLLTKYQPSNPVHPSCAICIGASNSGKDVLGGWADWVCSPINYQKVTGDHRSILKAPTVIQLARTVNAALSWIN